MLQYFETLQDESGNALLGATVLVETYPGGTVAPIYSTNGTAFPIALSTVTADITGQINFFAPDGLYTLVYSYNGTVYKTKFQVGIFSQQPTNSVTNFGATGNGTADDAPAIQLALNSGLGVTYFPPPPGGFYRCASNLTVPAGMSGYGLAFQPTNPPTGVVLKFDLAVAGAAVTVGGPSANNGSASLKGVSVTRAAGTPPVGSIGVLVQNTYADVIEDVLSVSHQVPFEFKGDKTVYGITAMVNRIFTGAAYDSHVVIDTFPEARFNQSRFGMDGAGDQVCNSYLRVQGGSTTNVSNGPNTTYFENCQFNQGANTGTNWIAFQNQTPGAISDMELFVFSNCYVEDNVVGVFTDASWTRLINLQFNNVTFNPSANTNQFFGLNAATQLNNVSFLGGNIKCALTYNGTQQINTLVASGTQFGGLVSLTGIASSTAYFTGCTYGNGLTVAGSWATFNAIGGGITGGTLTNTATGGVKIDLGPQNELTSFTPTFTLGGASVGMTYSLQVGGYQVFGNLVIGQGAITLSAKGSSTGQAAIGLVGLPALGSEVFNAGGGGVVNFSSAVAALTAAPVLLSIGAGPVLNLFQQGASGVGGVTDGNITNTTALRFTFQYFM